MKVFGCPTCKIPWADEFLLDGNRCRICGNVCIELQEPSDVGGVFVENHKQTLEEFLNDRSVGSATLQARRQCNREGHLPYVNDGQGMSGLIHGCYCGWIQLRHPASVPTPRSWSDLD